MAMRRPEWVIGAATLVCLPMVPDVLNGAISPTGALVRYVAAILVCWVLGSLLTAVLDRYADAAARRALDVQIARARAQNGSDPGSFQDPEPERSGQP